VADESTDEQRPSEESGADDESASQLEVAEEVAGADLEDPSAERPGPATALRRVLRKAFVLITLLTALVLALAGLLRSPWLAAAAMVVAAIAEWLAAYPTTRGSATLSRRGLGSRTRAMLRGVGVVVVLGVATGGSPVVLTTYAVTIVVAQLCWNEFSRAMSRAIALRPLLGVRNVGQDLELRTFHTRARRRAAVGPAIIVGIEAGVVVGLAAVLASSAPPALVSLVGVLGIAAMVAFAGFANRWSARFVNSGRVERYEQQLLAELEAFAPQGIVYVAAGRGQAYMFNQWMSAFNASPKRLIVVVREATHLPNLAETPWPVIYAPRTRDVERCVLPTVRLAFYSANSGKNVQLLREASVKHVFLNHGDSDKSTSANPVARVYDELWVAGPCAVDRYEAAGIEIARNRFAIIGRPQVDAAIVGPRRSCDGVRLLYAPTWEGYYEESNYSSLELMGPEMVRRLIAERPEWGIIFKPHPASGRQRRTMTDARKQIEQLLRTAPNAERHIVARDIPERSVYDWFDFADVCVSDISSVVTDFLYTDRPVVVSNPKMLPHDGFLEMFPSQQGSYVLDRDGAALLDLLDRALTDDPMFAQRQAMKTYLHGDLPQGPLRAFAANVERLHERAGHDLSRVRNAFTFTAAGGGKSVESFKPTG
jgi:hypothetical protein